MIRFLSNNSRRSLNQSKSTRISQKHQQCQRNNCLLEQSSRIIKANIPWIWGLQDLPGKKFNSPQPLQSIPTWRGLMVLMKSAGDPNEKNKPWKPNTKDTKDRHVLMKIMPRGSLCFDDLRAHVKFSRCKHSDSIDFHKHFLVTCYQHIPAIRSGSFWTPQQNKIHLVNGLA